VTAIAELSQALRDHIHKVLMKEIPHARNPDFTFRHDTRLLRDGKGCAGWDWLMTCTVWAVGLIKSHQVPDC
jgi:hypothetical protein